MPLHLPADDRGMGANPLPKRSADNIINNKNSIIK